MTLWYKFHQAFRFTNSKYILWIEISLGIFSPFFHLPECPISASQGSHLFLNFTNPLKKQMTSLATSLQLQNEQTNSWYICICCTLRSGLHEIPTMIRTFPHELENNHACKWIFENFPRILTYIYSWKIVLIPFACMVVL